MTRKELRASRVHATKKAQATRKHNLQLKANEPISSRGRKRARGLATKATSEEVSEVCSSDGGSADGCSDEDGASDAGKATKGTAPNDASDGPIMGLSNDTESYMQSSATGAIGKTVAGVRTSSPSASSPHTATAGIARVVNGGSTTNRNKNEAPAWSLRTPRSRTTSVGTDSVVGGSKATSGRHE